jgi:SRSO17 transposase
MATTSIERFAYMQAQRYWVERSFQDAKSELGMSDYQVRKWNGWYHHMALVMLSLSFIVRERLRNKTEYPLLSSRDVRIFIIALLTEDRKLIQKRLQQMETRHEQRRKDIQRHFKT